MSLVAAIQNALRQKSTSARERYLLALKAGKPADVIANLAREAGLSDTEILAHADVLEQAAALAEKVKRIPAAEEAARDAKKRLEDANAKLEKIIRPLEEESNACACEADVAATNLRNLKPSLAQLHSIYQNHPELLSMASAPEPLRKHVAAAAQENAADEVSKQNVGRVRRAEQKRDAAKATLNRAMYGELPMGEMELIGPNGVAKKITSHTREDGIASAQEKLAAAEKEYAEAIQAAPSVVQAPPR